MSSSPLKSPKSSKSRASKRSTPRTSRRTKKTLSSSTPIWLSLLSSGFRLAIILIGVATIVGTVMSTVQSQSEQKQLAQQETKEVKKETPESSPLVASHTIHLTPGEEIVSLKEKLQTLAKKYPKLQPQAFFIDLDNQKYVDLNSQQPISAASTIKIPVLIAFFQDVDAGKIRLDEMMVMKKELMAGGSGDMQYQTAGKKYTALEVATKMIIISDNTATNMLIERLGGMSALNQRFSQWGLTNTVLRTPLPDLKGTNTTSAKELADMMFAIHRGDLVSTKSRDRILAIMRETKTRTLLPQGLEEGALIAHKTGDIGTVLGDAGMIDMANGKRYLGAVMVQRPFNDMDGRKIIQEFSKTTYQHFKWYAAGSSQNIIAE